MKLLYSIVLLLALYVYGAVSQAEVVNDCNAVCDPGDPDVCGCQPGATNCQVFSSLCELKKTNCHSRPQYARSCPCKCNSINRRAGAGGRRKRKRHIH